VAAGAAGEADAAFGELSAHLVRTRSELRIGARVDPQDSDATNLAPHQNHATSTSGGIRETPVGITIDSTRERRMGRNSMFRVMAVR
jgi:hypothetical protein